MKDDSLDPRIDRMMAALYGELPESEMRAFERLLETDAVLRAEWDELRGSRKMLAAWDVEEAVPRFVMMESEANALRGAAAPAAPAAARPSGPSLWARLMSGLRGAGAAPAWGLATAAIAIAVFVLADGRSNARMEAELADLRAQIAATGRIPNAAPGATESRGLSLDDLAGSRSADSGNGVLTQASDTYLTRSEWDTDKEQFVQSLVTLLNEYGQRQEQENLDLLQAMYERINRQQLYDYRQLAGRVDNLGQELLVTRSFAEEKLEQLLGPAQPRERSELPPTSEDKE